MSRASVRPLLLALVAAALFVLIRHPGSVNRDRPSEGEPVAVRWPAGRPEPGELPAGPGELRWDPPGLTSLLPGPPPFVNRLGLFAGELEGFAQEIIGTMAREGRL